MTTREQIIAAAKQADPGFAGGPDADGTMADSIVGIDAVERFYTIAFGDGAASRDVEIAALRQQLAAKDDEIRDLVTSDNKVIVDLSKYVETLEQKIADRDEQISDLTISSDTYFAERNSARDVWRRASKDRDELRQQLAAAQAEVLEKGRVIGMAFKREIDLRQQLAEFKHGQDAYQQLFNNEKAENIWLHKQITMLRDTIRFFMKAESDYDLIEAGKKFTKALAETEPITNYGDDSIRRRNADDMGNPPANAAEMLNAWKSKP